MTKTLNLDALSTKESRELVLSGKTYKVREMSVETFIETTRAAEKMSKENFASQVSMTIDLIRMSIPDVSKEELMRMNIEQLRAVSAFIRGVSPEEIMAAESGAQAPEGGEQKN